MKTILVTGSGGLIGKESVEYFLNKGYRIIGVDNNHRKIFFGEDGSVDLNIKHLINSGYNYTHCNLDIRNKKELEKLIFNKYENDIVAIIHCAAQPSHDWSVKDVITDYEINSTATLYLLEFARKYCSGATFIFMSTNKVYGDNPNKLNFVELESRWELLQTDEFYNGINEKFSVDETTHSLFGCSKLSADMYVQEYGKYFGINTVVFRGGCLTGSKHSGAELHGFLNYLIKCNLKNNIYNIFGYKGKQVRDNIHSIDLVRAFECVIKNPKCGVVYNIGGSRFSNCSLVEAISIVESKTSIKMKINYVDNHRIGDHKWWISNMDKFKLDYPEWKQLYNINSIITEIVNNIQL